MTDDARTPPTSPEPGAGDATPIATPPAGQETVPAWHARLRQWLIVGGIAVVVIPAISLAAWTLVTLKFAYSSGDRAGYVQKISEKGWICATWEGELSMVSLPGAAPEVWSFTVRDDVVANAVRNSIGHKVALEYEEHRGIPSSCFGETRYFVVGVRRVAEP